MIINVLKGFYDILCSFMYQIFEVSRLELAKFLSLLSEFRNIEFSVCKLWNGKLLKACGLGSLFEVFSIIALS